MTDYNRRYKHWFWNSRVLIKLAQLTARFSSWLWQKQYGRK